MPDYSQHQIQADSNIAFVNFLISNNRFDDWSVTGCFYTAVHLIEMEIYGNNDIRFQGTDIQHSNDISNMVPSPTPVHNSPHAMRKKVMESNPAHFDRNVIGAYKTLERLSKGSRYLCYEIDEYYLNEAIDNLNVVIDDVNKRECVSFPRVEKKTA